MRRRAAVGPALARRCHRAPACAQQPIPLTLAPPPPQTAGTASLRGSGARRRRCCATCCSRTSATIRTWATARRALGGWRAWCKPRGGVDVCDAEALPPPSLLLLPPPPPPPPPGCCAPDRHAPATGRPCAGHERPGGAAAVSGARLRRRAKAVRLHLPAPCTWHSAPASPLPLAHPPQLTSLLPTHPPRLTSLLPTHPPPTRPFAAQLRHPLRAAGHGQRRRRRRAGRRRGAGGGGGGVLVPAAAHGAHGGPLLARLAVGDLGCRQNITCLVRESLGPTRSFQYALQGSPQMPHVRVFLALDTAAPCTRSWRRCAAWWPCWTRRWARTCRAPRPSGPWPATAGGRSWGGLASRVWAGRRSAAGQLRCSLPSQRPRRHRARAVAGAAPRPASRRLLLDFKREFAFEEVRRGSRGAGRHRACRAQQPACSAAAAWPTGLAPGAQACRTALHSCSPPQRRLLCPHLCPIPRRCCACGRRCGRDRRTCGTTCAWRYWSTTGARSSGAPGRAGTTQAAGLAACSSGLQQAAPGACPRRRRWSCVCCPLKEERPAGSRAVGCLPVRPACCA